MVSLRRRNRNGRGAAAVEFALIVPLLFLLVFGMIDFGYAINRYAMVNNAAREGVREASLMDTDADVKKSVVAAGEGITSGDVTLTCEAPGGGSCVWSGAESGGTAIVKVSYSSNWLTPVGSTITSKLNISKTIRMRIE